MNKSFLLKFAFLAIFLIYTAALLTNNASAQVEPAQIIDFKTSEEIKRLNKEIEDKNNEIENLSDQAGEYAEIIRQKQSEAESLQNELALIDNRIKKNEIDIERVETQIDQANLKIKETSLIIAEKEAEITLQKLQLASLIREIHQQDQKGKLEVLLLNDSLSKFFTYIQNLEQVQASVHSSLTNVQDAKRQLDIRQFDLELQKSEQEQLMLELDIQKQKLSEERGGKEQLIDETELSEQEYQKRLGEIRFQQRIADETISNLENEIKEKLRKAQQNNPNFVLNPGSVLWPIPNQGITTYYHDPSYPFRSIVGEHSGLDLRTLIGGSPSMGIPIRAPSGGVVVKTIRNGRYTGNAVFLSHGDLMTVFYHLSEIWVQEDDFVDIGQTMGLSGGAPGHPGAGLSSGPHLHFEVRSDGIPVDPCNYLTPSC